MTKSWPNVLKEMFFLTNFFFQNLKKLQTETEVANYGYGLASVVRVFHWLFVFSSLNLKKNDRL